MKTIGNLIWMVFVGFWSWLSWMFLGCVLVLLVVTAPFGRQCFKIANLSLWPMGRTAVVDPTASKFGVVGQVIWIVFAGIWLAIGYVITGIFVFCTIIGIPFALQSFKLAALSLAPFGKKVVSMNAPQQPSA